MMSNFSPRRIALRAKSLRRRFTRDKSGLAAVEFAMILPVMVTCYFGCLEVTQGFSASRKVSILSRSLSDLASQATTSINATEIGNIFDASRGVLAPFDVQHVKMTVTGVVFNGTALSPKAYTDWSATRNGVLRPCGELTQVANGSPPAPNAIPLGLVTPGTTLIVADVEYTYLPLVGGAFKSIGDGSKMSIPLKQTSYMRPRTLTRVGFTGTGVQCNPTFP